MVVVADVAVVGGVVDLARCVRLPLAVCLFDPILFVGHHCHCYVSSRAVDYLRVTCFESHEPIVAVVAHFEPGVFLSGRTG